MSTSPATATPEPEETFRYLATYELLHVHRVTVGITATDEEAAEEKARDLFDRGMFWDDTDQVRLISDDFEEADGQALTFEIEELEPGDDWPEPDASVETLKEQEAARELASRFIDLFREEGSVEMPAGLQPLYELALKACPHKASEQGG